MVDPIAGHSLGSIALPEDNHHVVDECPVCGGVKQAVSDVCQACYLKKKARRRNEIRSLARNLARKVLQGETLILEPGQDVNFGQALKAALESILSEE